MLYSRRLFQQERQFTNSDGNWRNRNNKRTHERSDKGPLQSGRGRSKIQDSGETSKEYDEYETFQELHDAYLTALTILKIFFVKLKLVNSLLIRLTMQMPRAASPARLLHRLPSLNRVVPQHPPPNHRLRRTGGV